MHGTKGAYGDGTMNVQPDPFAQYLDFTEHCAQAQTIWEVPFHPELVGNPLLQVWHGGVLLGIMQHAAQRTVPRECCGSQKHAVHPNLSTIHMDYLPSAVAQNLFVTADVLRKGGRFASLDVTLWHESRDAPTATAQARFTFAVME